MPASKEAVRLAAVGDLHCGRGSRGALRPLLTAMSEAADAIVLCGDMVDSGLPEEALILAKELSPVKIPVLAVLGNHEHECGKHAEVERILRHAGMQILDGDSCELFGVGFAGVKGFGGGFGVRALEPWGEQAMKRFVREAVDEALKLESALARLTTPQRVAILHYSPIEATLEGEARELFPFLGSSRLEEPLDRYGVAAVFHGHAHNGRLEGRTRGGVPVYNVAMPLLRRSSDGHPPFRVVEIPTLVR